MLIDCIITVLARFVQTNLASFEQFRPTFESALSYFVASNKVCTEDKGFAIKDEGWTNVRFENTDVIVSETTTGNGKLLFHKSQRR